MDFLIGAAYAFLGLGFLIFIHEMGHLLLARFSGIGVEAFSLFFGRAIYSFKWKGIEWKLGWIPFGGYCKMKGQEDFGEAETKGEADEFYQRPGWARLVAVFGGPLFNLILGFIMFIGIAYFIAVPVIPNWSIVVQPQYQNQLKLKTGDKIKAVDGEAVHSWNDLLEFLNIKGIHKEKQVLTIERDGEKKDIIYDFDKEKRVNKQIGFGFGLPKIVFVRQILKEIPVGKNKKGEDIKKKSPAFESALKGGDLILAANNEIVYSVEKLRYVVNQTQAGEEVELTVLSLDIPKHFPLKMFEQNILAKATNEADKKILTDNFLKNDKGYTLKDSISEQDRDKVGKIVKGVHFNFGAIVAIDGKEVNSPSDLRVFIDSQENSKHILSFKKDDKITPKVSYKKSVKIIPIVTQRKNIITNKLEDRKLVGIGLSDRFLPGIVKKSTTKNYSFGEAVVVGKNRALSMMGFAVNQFQLLGQLKAETVRQNIAGPLRIIKTLGDTGRKSIKAYIHLIALFSILLGIFNLLPIPAVDGGHIVITLFEMIRRKRFSPKVIQRIQLVGVFIVISLAVLVTVNDAYNLFDEVKKMFTG